MRPPFFMVCWIEEALAYERKAIATIKDHLAL
jgi:hypothetical protein